MERMLTLLIGSDAAAMLGGFLAPRADLRNRAVQGLNPCR